MTKNVKRRFLAILTTCLMAICCTNVAFAADETMVSECDYEIVPISTNEASTTYNTVIKNFNGTYSEWLDVPFTVTDSSRSVKVLYSIRMQDGSTPTTHLGVRMSDKTLWFWTKLNLSGESQIKEIGKLNPGNYVLRIKTKNLGDTYTIAGQIYYFG